MIHLPKDKYKDIASYQAVIYETDVTPKKKWWAERLERPRSRLDTQDHEEVIRDIPFLANQAGSRT